MLLLQSANLGFYPLAQFLDLLQKLVSLCFVLNQLCVDLVLHLFLFNAQLQNPGNLRFCLIHFRAPSQQFNTLIRICSLLIPLEPVRLNLRSVLLPSKLIPFLLKPQQNHQRFQRVQALKVNIASLVQLRLFSLLQLLSQQVHRVFTLNLRQNLHLSLFNLCLVYLVAAVFNLLALVCGLGKLEILHQGRVLIVG